MSQRIDTIVFDLGGVLIDWDPRYLYRKLIADEAELERFLGEVCTRAWNDAHDRGVPFADGIATLSQRHPERADLIAAYFERWDEMLAGPVEDTVSIVRQLRDRDGVRLYALTNWSTETFPIAQERYDFLGWFDGTVISGEERLAKPDDEIFRRLVDRFDLDPRRTLFIDDAEHNAEAARRVGMDAVLFTSPDQLRRDLADRGLLNGPG